MRLGISVFVALALLIGLACSESVADEPDGGLDDDGGRDAAAAHELPPYPGNRCLALDLRYDETMTSGCDPFSCTCQGQAWFDIPAVNPRLGCLTELNCDAACTSSVGEVFECIQQFVPCESDAECTDGYCARAEDQERGGCTTGEVATTCADDGDCHDGLHCVVVSAEGERACASGENNEPCNDPSQCESDRCVQSPQDTFAGLCSNGSNDQPCVEPSDCVAPSRCIKPDASRFGTCSTGGLATYCSEDADCTMPGPAAAAVTLALVLSADVVAGQDRDADRRAGVFEHTAVVGVCMPPAALLPAGPWSMSAGQRFMAAHRCSRRLSFSTKTLAR